ncbi:MAG: hypothetical protein IJK97_10920, partial [Thermoguttaceae bacterium]|nr:hypothetical protein [Thermoguttaceae bacterium]
MVILRDICFSGGKNEGFQKPGGPKDSFLHHTRKPEELQPPPWPIFDFFFLLQIREDFYQVSPTSGESDSGLVSGLVSGSA